MVSGEKLAFHTRGHPIESFWLLHFLSLNSLNSAKIIYGKVNCAPCVILCFYWGFLKLFKWVQDSWFRIDSQFIWGIVYRYRATYILVYLLHSETPGLKSIGRLSPRDWGKDLGQGLGGGGGARERAQGWALIFIQRSHPSSLTEPSANYSLIPWFHWQKVSGF